MIDEEFNLRLFRAVERLRHMKQELSNTHREAEERNKR